jgi:serine/threonine-protein kinase HipA
MGRKRKSRELAVAMNGHLVARWARSSSGAQSFTYDAHWLKSAIATPVSLSLPLSPDPYVGAVVAAFFDNLLPDNADIRRRMQSALRAESTHPFDLLSTAGADCVGALQLFDTPNMPDMRRVESVEVSAAEIAAILKAYRTQPLGMAPATDDFRISMAGAQEKTAFLWHRDAWHRPRGATPTTHVFKLPIGRIGRGLDLSASIPNEWLCLRIASAFGLPVADAEMMRFDDAEALVVRRFDRKWAEDESWIIRLPQEDLCQALGLPPDNKYEADGGPGIVSGMNLLLQSLEPSRDRSTFFRAAFVFWLLGAIDGHGKNFSVFLYPGGRIKLTPLYDILSAYPLTATRQLEVQKLRMAMAVVGKNRHYRWGDIRRDHWLRTAQKCHFDRSHAEAIIDECVSRVDDVIAEVSSQIPVDFPSAVAQPIFDGLRDAKERV